MCDVGVIFTLQTIPLWPKREACSQGISREGVDVATGSILS